MFTLERKTFMNLISDIDFVHIVYYQLGFILDRYLHKTDSVYLGYWLCYYISWNAGSYKYSNEQDNTLLINESNISLTNKLLY